jgi:hypothetical protein
VMGSVFVAIGTYYIALLNFCHSLFKAVLFKNTIDII